MSEREKIRYAVFGAGWFAQAAVLPGFANAKNAELAAIVSGDETKHRELGELYKVPTYTYAQYDELMAGGGIDAVYIVLPNAMHKEYTIRAARHKVHVLCEKPLASDAKECAEMIDACREAGVKLMTAYRLHFEPANLAAVETIRAGKIGEPRAFHGINCQMVQEDNTRLEGDLKGGPLMDLGVYCINAARYLFGDEPTEVTGFTASVPGGKFAEVPEMVTAVLRFPKDRLAAFSCGFGEAKVSEFRVIGTAGDIRLDPAFGFDTELKLHLTVGEGKPKSTEYRQHDHVGAEIHYFAECIADDREPEPNGYEGLIDLAIIDAIKESIRTKKAVPVGPFESKSRPTPAEEYKFSQISPPELINSESPAGK